MEKNVEYVLDVTGDEDVIALIPGGIVVAPGFRLSNGFQEVLPKFRGPVVFLPVGRDERPLSIRVQRTGHDEVVVVKPAMMTSLTAVEHESRMLLDRVVPPDPVD